MSHWHPAEDPAIAKRNDLIRHLHEHPDHAGNYPAGHDFALVSTADVRRDHDRQHPARGRCRYCGRSYNLNALGRVRRHRSKGSPCGGGGNMPA